MNKKTAIFLALYAGVVGALGYWLGVTAFSLDASNRAEDVVRREFQLLEQHSSVPSCSLLSTSQRSRKIGSDGAWVHWHYDAESDRLARLVVAPDLPTAHEEISPYCAGQGSPALPSRS